MKLLSGLHFKDKPAFAQKYYNAVEETNNENTESYYGTFKLQSVKVYCMDWSFIIWTKACLFIYAFWIL